MKKGFVLIEMIIYIGLFSILIGGLIVAAFQLMDTAQDTNYRTTTQEEMNFVLKKIDWALTGASNIETPAGALKITKAGKTIVFKKTNTKIEMCENNGATCTNFTPLTTTNVKVDSFTYALTGTSPKGIKIILVIDGQTSVSSKYLRI